MGTTMALPQDYEERVYAGILGKLIGVYLGRPFEGWTYERIMCQLGEIEYYVHDRLGDPLVVTDDDISGTFTFVRALEDCTRASDISSEAIGKTWLNYIVEKRSILCWEGNGVFTEHTAWLNLKRGITAPDSGSIATNGKTLAEQIGAQIFIDAWPMVVPGNPELAARLARDAARVSHDGEAVHAAMLWAAMEARAFVTADIDTLVETGLSVIPADCGIARLIEDVRAWHRTYPDWRDTRRQIAALYGYDRYTGICHVIPNHALMIMAILYASDDFSRAQKIVNTSGWDTDCNAGNVGCLLGLMHGLDGLNSGPDWRGPLADRMLISSADGGFAINDAVRMTDYITGLGHRLNNSPPPVAPKGGAQFHFSLPGSTQGFRISSGTDPSTGARVAGVPHEGRNLLSIGFESIGCGRSVVVTTPTFTTSNVLRMRTYELTASPLIYPGQELTATLIAPKENTVAIAAQLLIRRYGNSDRLVDISGPVAMLAPGQSGDLSWILPDCASQPIAEVGLSVTTTDSDVSGKILLDRLGWSGVPELELRPPDEKGSFWHRAWVSSADNFTGYNARLRIAQDQGEGLIIQGTRQWTDYRVDVGMTIHLASYAGLAARVDGLHRFYAATLSRDRKFQILRVRDDERVVLAQTDFHWHLDELVPLSMKLCGKRISASAGNKDLVADDSSITSLAAGGIGLLVADGAITVDRVRVSRNRDLRRVG